MNASSSPSVLVNEATYEEEDGVKSLYLSGSGAYATTPAVDFGKNSFTIASWVKLQSPANVISIIYSDWSSPFKFIVDAYDPSGRLPFGGMDKKDNTIHGCMQGLHQLTTGFMLRQSGTETQTRLACSSTVRRLEPNLRRATGTLGIIYDIGLKRDDNKTLRG
ncbi:hypothetical protein OS493_028931 [Desmophyllum pertusum]|uniref:Uncharacterized protein n=1 Tax=Desmophyllum pertusum TaxID=174260 RepID=A0A9X0CVE7_9CNID|nr:hypothetical protein OS493_028931 [Desmophyllum pertusum]